MALVLSCSVTGSREAVDGTGKAFTGYVIECKFGDDVWEVVKRYSQFYDLKQRMVAETIQCVAPFPAKKFGALSAKSGEQRLQQLDAYMRELSGSFLPEHVHELLCFFLEVKQNQGRGGGGGSGGGGGGSGGGGGGAAAVAEEYVAPPSPAAAAAPAAAFDANDPLAGLMGGASLEETPPPAPVAAPSPKPKPVVRDAPARPAPAAAAPPPNFFFHSQAKTYAANGEGLRDAIKNGDADGVKTVLDAAKECANYKDHQDQSMLHIAAIFNHTRIVDLLLEAGADPTVKNSENETAIDVAAPTLKRKMKAAAGIA